MDPVVITFKNEGLPNGFLIMSFNVISDLSHFPTDCPVLNVVI